MWFNFIKNDSPQRHRGTEKTLTFVIPAYDFASASALSKSEYPCGAKAGIQFDFFTMDSRFRGNDETGVTSVPLCLCGEVFELIAAFKVKAFKT
jgi:hypothetical protein